MLDESQFSRVDSVVCGKKTRVLEIAAEIKIVSVRVLDFMRIFISVARVEIETMVSHAKMIVKFSNSVITRRELVLN